MNLLYVKFRGSDGEGASVVLNGTTVYHEDDEKGFTNENFSALELTERIERAIGVAHRTIEISADELPEDWNFDDIEGGALRKAGTPTSDGENVKA